MFKFAIMGAGNIAGRFCRVVKTLENTEVTAVASKSKSHAEKFALENDIKLYYGSYEEMLLNADADAVYIATTNNFHYENIMLCLKHNIPVVCEKPLCMTKRQAQEVFEMSKAKNIFVMEAMWTHLLPSTLKAKELINKGVLGEIISADYNFGYKFNPDSRVFDPKTGGGALYDIGIYGIEGLMHLIDKPVDEVIPAITFNNDNIDTTDHITLRMGGCLAHMGSSITASLVNDAYIYGTKGMIHMENAYACRKFTLTLNDGTKTVYSFDFNDGFEFEISEAVRCITEGKIQSPYIPHKHTLKCAEIFDICLNKTP